MENYLYVVYFYREKMTYKMWCVSEVQAGHYACLPAWDRHRPYFSCLAQARQIPHTGQAGRLPVMLFKIFNRKLNFLSRKRCYEKIKWRYLWSHNIKNEFLSFWLDTIMTTNILWQIIYWSFVYTNSSIHQLSHCWCIKIVCYFYFIKIVR